MTLARYRIVRACPSNTLVSRTREMAQWQVALVALLGPEFSSQHQSVLGSLQLSLSPTLRGPMLSSGLYDYIYIPHAQEQRQR